MTSKAKLVLEKYNKIKGIKESDLPPEQKVDMAPTPIQEKIGWMKENKWSESNELQSQAADAMKNLAESDDEEANKFMEYMDDCASQYGQQSQIPTSEADDEEEDDDKEKSEAEDDDEEDKDDKSESDDSDDEEDDKEKSESDEEPSDDEEEKDKEAEKDQAEKFKKNK